MRALDLFCGAGGASEGLHRAGFAVTGVDQEPQSGYPHNFIQRDVLDLSLRDLRQYDLVWASPPCQSFSAYRRKGHGVGDKALNLIPQTRALLKASGVPYIIENVPKAPLESPVTLCGSMFGLDVRRHRIFECSFPVRVPACNHGVWTEKKYPGATNRPTGRYTCEVGVYRIPLEQQRAAMGIEWMNLKELSQAIPPAYSQFLALHFLKQIEKLTDETSPC